MKRNYERGMPMENIRELVRARRSVRSFDSRELSAEDREKLTAFMEKIENPYDIPVRFRLLSARKSGLTSPVITGADCYVGARVGRLPGAEEAFGYSFEMLVLYAQSLGIGTTWIGGTMDRAAFERAMELREEEMMPCVSPLGYPAAKMSLREIAMRKGVRADHRAAFGQVFFDGDWQTPLTEEKAGHLRDALEAVRWAPSAVNKQPWRLVATEKAVHFYEQHSKGYVSPATGDLQKVDMGIALCHFALAARESGLRFHFERTDPGLPTPDGTEYIASYCFDEP